VDDDKDGTTASGPTSWAELLAAYRGTSDERWSSNLLERLEPWLMAAKRQLRAVPPYLDAEDVAHELALQVLRIAARWRPACEDRWIPRRLVEKAARHVSKALIRERLAATEELDHEMPSEDQPEPQPVFDTPVGKATPADLRVLYRYKVLGEPIPALARESGLSEADMRRRIRVALSHARAGGGARDRE
jgi:DNA-directed RNA polymerase specialized sigma24 family protein